MWDKAATRLADKENWMEARKKKNSTEEKYKFVTFVPSKQKPFTEHTKSKSKDIKNKVKDKPPRDFGPEDITIHTRSEGPTVQLSGDSDVTCKWINGETF